MSPITHLHRRVPAVEPSTCPCCGERLDWRTRTGIDPHTGRQFTAREALGTDGRHHASSCTDNPFTQRDRHLALVLAGLIHDDLEAKG
jgi:hypothetical protein